MGKIINIIFFYKLKNYLKTKKTKKSFQIFYNTINTYYNCKLGGNNLTYLLKSENYIKFMLAKKSVKGSITNLFLQK